MSVTRLGLVLLRGLMCGLACLPLPWVRALGTALGWLLYGGASARRHVVRVNLRLCFPTLCPQARERAVRQTFICFAQAFLDRAWLWHSPQATLAKRIRFIDPAGVFAHPCKQQLRPTPIVIFAPHFVGMDVGWTALNRLSARSCVGIYARQKNPIVDAWMHAGRSRHQKGRPAPQFLDARANMRPLIKALRAGAALYVLPDMNYDPRDSLFPTFFGVPAATLPLLHRYAELGRTPSAACQVIPLVTRMTKGGYEVVVHPAWADYPSDDPLADTQRMNHALEGFICSRPDMLAQYYWVHKRFKDQPQGNASPY